MRTLYTLDSCVMKHSVSRSRLSARRTRHLISLTLFGYRTADRTAAHAAALDHCALLRHSTSSHTRCAYLSMCISLRGVIGFSSGSAASLCRCRRAIWDPGKSQRRSQRSRKLPVVSWPHARTHGRTSYPLHILKGGEHKLGGLRGPFPFPSAVLLGHIKVELPRRR